MWKKPSSGVGSLFDSRGLLGLSCKRGLKNGGVKKVRVVKGIYDGGVVRLLEPIEAKEKTPVEVIFKEEVETKDNGVLKFKGVPGRQLLRFAGSIPANDLQTMTQAIEAGCEGIDRSEW
jgi:hypothetical protein